MSEKQQLRELHDTYVWEVNAAIGEGRIDLVWGLADEYLDQALELITGGEQTGCEAEDCAVCQRPRTAPPRSRGRMWSRLTRHTRASGVRPA